MVLILRIFAGLELICSVVIALWFWRKFGIQPSEWNGNLANLASIGVGVAILINGVVICTFFIVIASMSENVTYIKNHMLKIR